MNYKIKLISLVKLEGTCKYILKSIAFPELRVVARTSNLSISGAKAEDTQVHSEFEASLSYSIETPSLSLQRNPLYF